MANSLVGFGAILMISIPQSFYAIFFARFVAGIGHGLAYVAVVQHFGEICDRQMRGRLGTSLHLFILKGGIISGSLVIRFFSAQSRMDPNRFLGIFSLCLSCIAMLMTLVFFKESIVTLVQQKKENEAVEMLVLLRGQSKETPEITAEVNEIKMMLAEDKHKSSDIFSDGNLKPLLIVTLLRIAFVLSFNYGLKYIHVVMTHKSKSGTDYTFILNLIHTFVVVFVMFTIDNGLRRNYFMVSAVGTSLILIVFGCLRASMYADLDLLVFIMFVCFEFFSAIGLGLTAHIYSTEAFATPKKSASIAFSSIIEHICQIAFLIWVDNQIYSNSFDIILLIFSGSVLGAITIYLFLYLPETRSLSICETKNKFL